MIQQIGKYSFQPARNETTTASFISQANARLVIVMDPAKDIKISYPLFIWDVETKKQVSVGEVPESVLQDLAEFIITNCTLYAGEVLGADFIEISSYGAEGPHRRHIEILKSPDELTKDNDHQWLTELRPDPMSGSFSPLFDSLMVAQEPDDIARAALAVLLEKLDVTPSMEVQREIYNEVIKAVQAKLRPPLDYNGAILSTTTVLEDAIRAATDKGETRIMNYNQFIDNILVRLYGLPMGRMLESVKKLNAPHGEFTEKWEDRA